MIDKATVERIKDAADIVEVVSDYVHLTRRGANYMGLCPFHNEKTPSFSVSPRRNFCYCFSCHKGGSPVNFVMEKEGVSYHDALLQLAKKYGIKVEERELTDEERQAATEREGLMIAAQRAMQIMESDLTQNQEGREIGLSYLYGRGVTDEAIRKFHLGYAIDKGQYLTPRMQREGYDTSILQTLGLTGQSQSGNLYDKYRGRVIFPIMNSSGKVVGFGGRDLKGGPAKYINSPESTLYHKNLELYGIFQAKAEIVRQNRCYLVEGYLDVISMWQSGLQNVVASSGTALTDGQIAMIHRFTENITLIYDGDAAGIKAALRGIDMLLSHKMQVSVLLLPDGHDPDSFARSHTPEDFREFVSRHETDIIRFKMRVLMAEVGNSPQKKAEVINSVARSIACIPNDVQRTVYIGECSREMNIDEAAVSRAVESARQSILEQNRAERRRRQAQKDYPADLDSTRPAAGTPVSKPEPGSKAGMQPDGDPSAQEADKEVSLLAQNLETKQSLRDYPLMPLEKNVIRYLVRYGYMQSGNLDNVVPSENEDVDTKENLEVLYTLTDHVNYELLNGNLHFSIPVYQKIFDLLLNEIDDYIERLDRHKEELEKSLAEKRKQMLNDIAARVTTMADIDREERMIETSIEKLRNDDLHDFARNYPGDFLASHEDGEVRTVATELLNDRHILSSLFTNNQPPLNDLDIFRKVNRAIMEWKSELVNLHLHDLLEKLRNSTGENPEEDRNLQIQIAMLMQTRSEMAKNCGERIISMR